MTQHLPHHASAFPDHDSALSLFRDVLEAGLIETWQLIAIRGSGKKKLYYKISSFRDRMCENDINQNKKNRVSGVTRKKMR